jgi:nucleotide-binding universal stress UspA family protein
VRVRRHDAPHDQAIAKEAEKGYDLLFIGVTKARARSGAFHPDVTRIAASFEGPLAIVAASGKHLREPERSPLDILVPVNGTEVSRRAAEVALAIARSCGSPIAALYVATDAATRRPPLRARREQESIIKDVIAMADRYDVKVRTEVRSDVAPDTAILAEAGNVEHRVIIMGVSRRPGDELAFGDTAAAVFERARTSTIFVAS